MLYQAIPYTRKLFGFGNDTNLVINTNAVLLEDADIQLFKDNKFEANSFFNKVINMSDNSKIYYIGYDENSVMYKEKFFDVMKRLRASDITIDSETLELIRTFM